MDLRPCLRPFWACLVIAIAAPMACGRTELDDLGQGPTGGGGSSAQAGAGGGEGGDGGGTTTGQGGGGGGSTGGTGGRVTTGGGGGTGGAGTGGAGGVRTGGAGGGTGGAGGIVGTGGAGGRATGGTGGITPPPTPIPCGMTSCTPGAQTCCIRQMGGAVTSTCIAAGATCAGGASFACVDSPSCGSGLSCCLSLLGFSTTCMTATACGAQPGTAVLCTTSADCTDPTAPNCCPVRRVGGVCTPRPCR